jgi:putative membrane protein
MNDAASRLPAFLLGLVGLALLVSAIAPYDRATWWMEVAPVLILAPVLVATHRRFPLTSLLQVLIAAHALVLIVGGVWTYARVPFGFWLQDVLALERNPYDRIGHFMQGCVPAIAAREILLRQRVVRGRGWLFFLVSCVCLAISAVYELVEWRAAVMLGQGADAFLGTQGDPWDTQSDMAMALVGAVSGQILLGGWHDRQLARIGGGLRRFL